MKNKTVGKAPQTAGLDGTCFWRTVVKIDGMRPLVSGHSVRPLCTLREGGRERIKQVMVDQIPTSSEEMVLLGGGGEANNFSGGYFPTPPCPHAVFD